MISSLITILIKLLPDDIVSIVVNTVCDVIENLVISTSTNIDNLVVLPILAKLRTEVNGNPNLPGDYINRVEGYYNYARKYLYILTPADILECEKIITSEGEWQGAIERYIQSKINS
jgi:hypothetical protein